MNEQDTIYTLNENCIANEIDMQGSQMQRLLVPHLSVLVDVRDALSGNIKSLSDSMDGKLEKLSCQFETGPGEIISSIVQENGKVSIGKRPMSTLDISSISLIPEDFCSNFQDRRIYFGYEDRKILLGLEMDSNDKSKMLSIDCNDFIKDGMLLSVSNGYDQALGPFIELVFNTDAGKDAIKLWAREIFKQFYTGLGVVKVNEQFEISVDINQLRDDIDYNNLYEYYQFLAGLGAWHDIGAIGQMSSDISSLFKMGSNSLKSIGHIAVQNMAEFESKNIVQYLSEQLQCLDKFPNGSFITIELQENHEVGVSKDGLSVGNGDIIIIKSHGYEPYINVDDISLANGTLYLLKAGVSRYEHEKNTDDITRISNWIDASFTGFPDDSQTNIITKKDVVVDDSLSARNVSSESITSESSWLSDSYISNLTAKNSQISNATVSNLTVDVISAREISVNVISALNLNYGKVDLKDDGEEVVSVITSISETNGIISVCGAKLE